MAEAITKFQSVEGGLTLLGDPERMLEQAGKVADALMKVVESKELYQTIGKKRHMYVEAWEILGHFYGITAICTEVEPYVDEITGAAGFKATAEALMISTDPPKVISRAYALCLNNEDNWNERPKYEWKGGDRKQVGVAPVPSFQLSSMAQTRAIGKVLANVLRFIPGLRGYSGTPAEEMTGNETQAAKAQPEQSNGKNGDANRISDPQRKRLFAIAKEVGCPMNNLVLLFQKKYGFKQAFEVTREKYDALVNDVKNWQNVPEAHEQPPKEGAA